MSRRIVAFTLVMVCSFATLHQASGLEGSPDHSAARMPQAANEDFRRIAPGPEPAGLSKSSATDDVIPVVAERIFVLGRGRGFAGQRTDYENRSIAVQWAGEPPQEVLSFIASQPYGITVTISADAKYSHAQANAALDRLVAAPVIDDLGLAGVSIAPGASGVVVELTRTAALTRREERELRRAAGIPDVFVRYGVEAPVGYAE